MKKVVNHLHEYRQKVHTHVKKHYKKYLFGIVSAALIYKIIPVLIAWIFMTKNFSFADLVDWADYETCSVAWTCDENANDVDDDKQNLDEDFWLNDDENNDEGSDDQQNILRNNAESLDDIEENQSCGFEDIEMINPLSGMVLWWTFQIKWWLKNSDCSGYVLTIKMWDANSQYVLLWTWLAQQWVLEFDSTKLFSWFYTQTWLDISGNVIVTYTWNYEWLPTTYFTWHRIVIYLWEETDEDWLLPLYEWNDFVIDNEKPIITWVNISITWSKNILTGLVWLNDVAVLSFTASEELSWSSIVVLWKNAVLKSVSWFDYVYELPFSESNTSWVLIYNITCKDIAWNESYYEWYNEKLIFDKERPSLTKPIQFAFTWDLVRYRLALTETWDYEFAYQLSWDSEWNIKTWEDAKKYTDIFSWIESNEIYNYKLTLVDKAWNDSYLEWYFMITWDTIESITNLVSSWNLVEVWFLTEEDQQTWSIIQWLKQQIFNYNACKSWLENMKTIELPIKNYTVKLEMPDFEKSAVKKLVSSFAIVLYEKIEDSNMTQKDVEALTSDFNEYLVVLKLLRDDEWVCKQNLSNYYTSKFMNGLMKYDLATKE